MQKISYENLKRLFSVVAAAISLLFSTALPFSGNEITINPSVFEYGGDCYCVMWTTAKKGTGYVRYTYKGEEKTIWDEDLGVIRTDDFIHRVFVPKEELRDNDYCVGSQYVYFKYAKTAIKGKTIESESYHFNGVDKEDDINILCMPDIHADNDRARTAAAKTGIQADIVMILGDVVSKMEEKANFTDTLLSNASALTKGTIPVVYIRGNHETRGEFAAQLMKYLPTYKTEPYFCFDFGAMSAVCLDTGEDKEDDHIEYSGLVNFSDFRAKEFEWIRSLKADDFTGKYKIVFTHVPGIQDFWNENWAKPFADIGFDLVVGAHLHTCKSWNWSEIPIVCVGGKRDNPADYWACSMNLKDGAITVKVNGTDGGIVYSFDLAADGTWSQDFNF